MRKNQWYILAVASLLISFFFGYSTSEWNDCADNLTINDIGYGPYGTCSLKVFIAGSFWIAFTIVAIAFLICGWLEKKANRKERYNV